MSHSQGAYFNIAAYKPLTIATDAGALLDDSVGDFAQNITFIKTAFGGWWSMKFTIKDDRNKIDEWLEDGLGRHIEAHDPNLMLYFDGFTSKISANIGGLTYEIGPLLDTVANKVRVAYSTVDTSATPPAVGGRATTAWAEDSDSQDRYGIIERVVSVGGVSEGEETQLRDVALDELKDPQPNEQDNISAGGAPELSAVIEVLGYVHWLKAYTYESTTTGLQNLSAKIQAILTADPNSIFSTDYSDITTNTTQVGAWENDNKTAWNLIKSLTALGDSSNDRYTFGVYKDRKAIYSVLPTTQKYSRTLADPSQAVETYDGGRRLRPWEVEPAEWVFYPDFLVGRVPQPTTLRDDPRNLFIEQLNYTLPWNLSLDGARISRLDTLLDRMGLGGSSG